MVEILFFHVGEKTSIITCVHPLNETGGSVDFADDKRIIGAAGFVPHVADDTGDDSGIVGEAGDIDVCDVIPDFFDAAIAFE